MRTAVKYSIEAFIKTIPILNKYGIEIYIDEVEESFIVDFVKQNVVKFVSCLHCALDSKLGEFYKNGPHCTKEFRFVKNGKYNGNRGLNSRIYVIKNGNKLILCLIDLNKKQDNVSAKIANKLKNICKDSYSFKDSMKILIEM